MPAPGQFYVPCALFLEDNPTEYVRWESFPTEEGIMQGYNADFAKSGGRASAPYMRRWTGGDWNPIQLTLQFRAGINPLEIGSPPAIAIGRMVNKVNWLQAASFPRPKTRPTGSGGFTGGGGGFLGLGGLSSVANIAAQLQGLAADPPRVLFVWGFFMTLKGYIEAWTVTWKGPFEVISGKPHGAEVGLTFQPHDGTYPNWYDVRDGNTPSRIVGRFI